MSDDEDDDIEEYLDPELDPVGSTGGFELPGPLSVPGLITGLHFMAAALVLPVAWVSVQNGAYLQAGFYSVLAGLMVAAGVVVGRIAERRYD
ncbi:MULTISPECIES: hypothetical protein [Salinibaculum]|uniref:hypothetical protein n=1 Tax=Salinibaculum TaxID=2732368 RepID=UPI0030D467BF